MSSSLLIWMAGEEGHGEDGVVSVFVAGGEVVVVGGDSGVRG